MEPFIRTFSPPINRKCVWYALTVYRDYISAFSFPYIFFCQTKSACLISSLRRLKTIWLCLDSAHNLRIYSTPTPTPISKKNHGQSGLSNSYLLELNEDGKTVRQFVYRTYWPFRALRIVFDCMIGPGIKSSEIALTQCRVNIWYGAGWKLLLVLHILHHINNLRNATYSLNKKKRARNFRKSFHWKDNNNVQA